MTDDINSHSSEQNLESWVEDSTDQGLEDGEMSRNLKPIMTTRELENLNEGLAPIFDVHMGY